MVYRPNIGLGNNNNNWFSNLFNDIGTNISNFVNNFPNHWNNFWNGITQTANDIINPLGYQRQIDQENLQFQQEVFDYQQELQQEIFDREDNAYQRTVNDMRSAGLSPLAMSGTNNAGEAIAVSPSEHTADPAMASNMLFGMINSVLGIQKQKADIDYMKAEKDKIFSEIANLNDQTSFNQSTQMIRKYGIVLDNWLKNINVQDLYADKNIREKLGIRKGASQDEIKLQLLKRILGIKDQYNTTYNVGVNSEGNPYMNLNGYYDNNTPNVKDMLGELTEAFGMKKDNKLIEVIGKLLNW